MQEESSIRKEQARRATEEKIQAQQRETEKEMAEIERETIRVKAMAEAEGRAHEAKLTEDHKRRTILGQPSLIGESSIAKFPWSGVMSQARNRILNYSKAAPLERKKSLQNVVRHPSLKRRIENLARATANTKTYQAPLRNMLFYGPPDTGKTMVAREMSQKSGLDYAMMTGGDVAPLGDKPRDIVIVLATNRPGDLDNAITDRIDDVIEFPFPGEEERFQLLKLYSNKYLGGESDEGFSGCEIAKLVASIQAAAYGHSDCVLDSQLFKEIVNYKVAEHHQRIKLAAEGGLPS
ncbi:putative late embryoproteinsis abundant [Hibiscus syriacus]|uniref:Late embryoproteinsis abundant n=1 Tax=Hibiscus syriacus TaxID=106335 RepID=A0A6A2XRZ4_HIBSY|nr:putative late embryoproteinsis abundant [Hibiscus syriacus]